MGAGTNVIACIGWGSLVWDPRDLPIDGNWRANGPLLPLEFARESGATPGSRGDRITIVICAGNERVKALWSILDVRDILEARQKLAQREQIGSRWKLDVGFADCSTGLRHGEESDVIAAWAAALGLDGAVWTNLPPKFNGVAKIPSEDEVIQFLSGLDGDQRAGAERYIRQAPPQIRTPYRIAIERTLGWEGPRDCYSE